MVKIIHNFKKEYQLWLIILPMLIWVSIFAYYPMYGVIIAFLNFTPGQPILGSKFVGLENFIQLFSMPDFFLVIRNTIAISFLHLAICFPAPILFALLINELRVGKFKKVIQTMSYLPHFISWVVVASLAITILGSDGIINDILLDLKIIKNSIPFLSEGRYYWFIYTFIQLWKTVGWSSIIYLSAMSGIDVQLYESGDIDGLTRIGKMLYITLPGIAPTIVFLWVFSVANILNAGFQEHLLLGNIQTREYWDTIDTYSYRYGIQLGRYSFATAVSFFKGAIGLSLMLISNNISKRLTNQSIF